MSLATAVATIPAAGAATVTGHVWADVDGDGSLSAADTPLGDAVVFFEDSLMVRTGADGSFTLDIPTAGMVWVRPPEGYSPAPVWTNVSAAGAADVVLLLRPHPVTLPLRFVHVSDTHLGVVNPEDVASALALIVDPTAPPHFVVGTGDLTGGSSRDQFRDVVDAFRTLPVPFVPGLGNHDWWDGGANWREFLGPPAYSFDAGGVHFIMVHGNVEVSRRIAFVEMDMSTVPPGTPTYAFIHYPITLPYDQELYDGLVRNGVTHLFTGHYHAHRLLEFAGLVEHNVQPLAMGGMQLIPAGYEVVTVVAGQPHTVPKFVVQEPFASFVSPRPGACLPAGEVPFIVAVEVGEGAVEVTVTVDSGPPVFLTPLRGWDHAATLQLQEGGSHVAQAHVRRAGNELVRQVDFCIESGAAPTPTGDWTQLGGGSNHENAATFTLGPPLRPLWAQNLDGFSLGGSPVVANGMLFAPVADFGTDARGGIVALDAKSGTRLWEQRLGRSVQSTPAVTHGLVIVAPVDGVLRAFDVTTGLLAWQMDLGRDLPPPSRELYSAPVVAGDVVYAGHMYRFVALDAATGTLLWEAHPSTNEFVNLTRSTAAVDGDRVVGVFGHGVEGIYAWNAEGDPLWLLADGLTRAMTAPPLLAGNVGFFSASGGTEFAVDLLTGQMGWSNGLLKDGFEYAFWLRAAPALAQGRLFVPTQMDQLFALDVNDGQVIWSQPAGDGVLRSVHYRAAARAFSTSPVVTGNVVWIAGDDGILRAMNAGSGRLLWSYDLGAPALSGVVPVAGDTGGFLYVATFDGTIRALIGSMEVVPDPAACGCSPAGAPAGGKATLVLVIVALLLSRRRRRPHPAR